VLATLKQLRATYGAAGETDAVARTDRQIEQFRAASRAFAPAPSAVAGKDRRYKWARAMPRYACFMAPTASSTGSLKPAEFYGAERGELPIRLSGCHHSASASGRGTGNAIALGHVHPVHGQDGLRSRFVLLDQVMALSRGRFPECIACADQAGPV